jgi:hypothetical protein
MLHKLGQSQDQNFDSYLKQARVLKTTKHSIRFHTNRTNRQMQLISMCVVATLSN